MKWLVALTLITGCAHEAAQTSVYGVVAPICTARKQQLLERASTPPTPPETAAWETTRRLCQDILDAIVKAEGE